MKATEKLDIETANPCDLYVYWSDMFDDLFSAASEYIGECEHAGYEPSSGEISIDTVPEGKTVNDVKELRKKLLLADFIRYWAESSGLKVSE